MKPQFNHPCVGCELIAQMPFNGKPCDWYVHGSEVRFISPRWGDDPSDSTTLEGDDLRKKHDLTEMERTALVLVRLLGLG